MLMNEVFAKYFKEKPEKFLDMARTALDGISSVDPSLDTDSFLKFMYHLNDIECKNLF